MIELTERDRQVLGIVGKIQGGASIEEWGSNITRRYLAIRQVSSFWKLMDNPELWLCINYVGRVGDLFSYGYDLHFEGRCHTDRFNVPIAWQTVFGKSHINGNPPTLQDVMESLFSSCQIAESFEDGDYDKEDPEWSELWEEVRGARAAMRKLFGSTYTRWYDAYVRLEDVINGSDPKEYYPEGY